MRLLITGAKGQLGTELVRLGSGHKLLAVGHDQLDITDASVVIDFIDEFQPDAVINAAAYTAVDRAESDKDAAFAVNRDGPANLARACECHAIPLIHISTDYVFDGSKPGAYVEGDHVSPLGVYGQSKLAGEQAVQALCSRFIVLRTSWVFSTVGNNFVITMLRLGAERDELGIVADQQGCPTAAAELARAIYAVLNVDLDNVTWGVYHFCQPEPTTWFGFAESIFAGAKEEGMDMKVSKLTAIATSDYPTPAKRPVNSQMDCTSFSQVFGYTIKPWAESLNEVIKELKNG